MRRGNKIRYLLIALLGIGGCLKGPFEGTVDHKYYTESFVGQRKFYIQVKTLEGDYKTAHVEYRSWRETGVGEHVSYDDNPQKVVASIMWGFLSLVGLGFIIAACKGK